MGIAAKLATNRRLTLGSVFLVVNALVWYTITATVLGTAIENNSQVLMLWSLHFSALIISLFVGILLTKKIGIKHLLLIWTSVGIISPLTLFAINYEPITFLAVALFGVSLGLGLPSCLGYFSRLTEEKNRGRYAGLMMLFIVLSVALLSVLGGGNVEFIAVILVIWRVFGLLFLFTTNLQSPTVDRRQVSFSFVLRQRSFILYLIPWLMFSLVGYLSVPVQENVLSSASVNSLMLIESIIGGVFAVISGLLIGFVGRKRIAILAFVLVGIEFSILGMYPDQMASWIIYTVLDGIAFGTFYVLFIMSIWGDLSQNASAEKYYAIGIIPFFISKYLSLVLARSVAAAVSVSMLFSFTAFFLFLAVLPLVYAPETLPEKIMKDRELKSYIEKAQKMVEKEQTKQEPEDKKPKDGKGEASPPEDKDDYEKAKQLAEKYY